MKYALAVLAFLTLGLTTRADSTLTTWDFSFYSVSDITDQPDGVVSGSGSFQTLPVDQSPYQGSLEIVSTTGTMNGQSMSFVPLLYNAIDWDAASDPYTAFLNYAFYFNVDGAQYSIHDVDVDEAPLYTGNTLYGPLYNGELLDVTLADPTPVTTPEPRGIELLCIGMLGIFVLFGITRVGRLGCPRR